MDDLSLKLLAGQPIDIGIGKIHPLTLREIMNIGEITYNQYLSILLFNKTLLQQEELKQLSDFEVFSVYCFYNESFRNLSFKALELFFKETPLITKEGVVFFDKQRVFNESAFNQMRLVLKKQNYLKDESEKEFKPANDKARELQEKLKQIKSKIKEQNKNDGLNLSDIISIVSAYLPNVNIFNVWDLTVYQLYELYIRLIMKDKYESEFAIYLQGEDPKKLDLKHWASKIEQ